VGSPDDPFHVPFAAPVDISKGAVTGISSLDVRDLNQDGKADIATICGGIHSNGSYFCWYEAPDISGGEWIRHEFNPEAPLKRFLGAARFGDMDNDGDADLVVSSDMHSGELRDCDVFVFINPLPARPASTPWKFHIVTREQAWHHINDMEVEDMDGDGKLDIIARSLEPNEIHIFFQDSLDTWTRKSIPSNLEQSEGLAIGDLDKDNIPDISYTGYVLKAPPNPRAGEYIRIAVDAGYAGINQNTKETLGDIDGDGRLDLLLAPAEKYRQGKPHDLAWYRNPGGDLTGPWEKHIVLPMTNNTHTVKLGLINDDDLLDIITGIAWDDLSVKVYYNLGEGAFSKPQTINDENGLYTGVVIDFDGDGDVDIIGQETYGRSSKPYLYESLLKD